jgi:hypothetical protein
MSRCANRHMVDRHFAGQVRPTEEASLREHLPGCESCRRYYERHLLLAELDPSALGAQERIAIGLGVSTSASTLWSLPRAPLLAAAALAACLALFMLRPVDSASEFQARGIATEPRVWVYRVGPDGKPVELGDVMAPNDELAFAFDNPGDAQRLLLFGVDEHRHLYWYHPAWLDPATTPTAVPAATGRHELPEAVSHQLDGGMLTLYAVFTSEGVTVRDVERGLDAYTRRAAWQQRVRVAR